MTLFVRDLILSAGKTIVFIGSLISFLLAVGYLAFPDLLKSISGSVNRLFVVDEWLYVNRMVVGIVFLVVAVILFGVLIFVK